MKTRALNEALRMVGKVCSDPRIDPDLRDQLLKTKRGLKNVSRSGRLDEKRIFLAVESMASVLLRVVEDEATRR